MKRTCAAARQVPGGAAEGEAGLVRAAVLVSDADQEMAEQSGMSESRDQTALFRIRNELRAYFEREE